MLISSAETEYINTVRYLIENFEKSKQYTLYTTVLAIMWPWWSEANFVYSMQWSVLKIIEWAELTLIFCLGNAILVQITLNSADLQKHTVKSCQ